MTATIKKIEITEAANLDATHFKPDDPEDFIGTFGFTVCTPKRLEKLCEKDGFVWGRHHLVVPHFNLEKIRSIFTKFANNCSAQT